MGITRLSELLQQALQGVYCVGYFESWDQYSLDAVLEASEEMAAPTIFGFGAAVTNESWMNRHGVEELVSMARLIAGRARVPAAVLFNEARNIEQARRAMDAGCNAVMLDTSHLAFSENIELTNRLVAIAHPRGVEVEAELGHLGDATNQSRSAHTLTDPEEAAAFVQETGVDALAVSVGTVHCSIDGEKMLDLALLAKIHESVHVPLVLHGGSGLAPSMVRPAAALGLAKINYGTRLKQSFLYGLREAIAQMPAKYSIHEYIGSKAAGDILMRGKERLKEHIKTLMELYGCAGKARSVNDDQADNH